MNYLKKATDRLLIAINGYKTPEKAIELVKQKDLSYLIINPPWQSKKKQ
jgi:hypothetical protein